MTRAYVLINVETGKEESVLKDLKNLAEVEEAYVSYGVYDLLVKVCADTMKELKDSVVHEIRLINHVRSTLTLILVE